MQTKDPTDTRVRGIVTALSLNRGEIDAAALERLLGLIEPQPGPPAPTKG